MNEHVALAVTDRYSVIEITVDDSTVTDHVSHRFVSRAVESLFCCIFVA